MELCGPGDPSQRFRGWITKNVDRSATRSSSWPTWVGDAAPVSTGGTRQWFSPGQLVPILRVWRSMLCLVLNLLGTHQLFKYTTFIFIFSLSPSSPCLRLPLLHIISISTSISIILCVCVRERKRMWGWVCENECKCVCMWLCVCL